MDRGDRSGRGSSELFKRAVANFPQLLLRLVPFGKDLAESLVVPLFEGFVKVLQLLDVLAENRTDPGLIGHQNIPPDREGTPGETSHITPPTGGEPSGQLTVVWVLGPVWQKVSGIRFDQETGQSRRQELGKVADESHRLIVLLGEGDKGACPHRLDQGEQRGKSGFGRGERRAWLERHQGIDSPIEEVRPGVFDAAVLTSRHGVSPDEAGTGREGLTGDAADLAFGARRVGDESSRTNLPPVTTQKIEDRANRGGQVEQVCLAGGAVGKGLFGTIDDAALHRPLQGTGGIVGCQHAPEAGATQGKREGPTDQPTPYHTDLLDLRQPFHPHLSTIGAS